MAVPVLIFGLGGTGGEVTNSFAKLISERAKKSDVKTIAIDTDRSEVDSLGSVDERIVLGEPKDINMDQLARESEWFPFDRWPRSGRDAAAGRIRPISAFLIREIEDNRRLIGERVNRILAKMRQDFAIDLLNVWIISSSGGGSGSGMFCDFAELITHILQNQRINYLMNGILILPTGLGFENVEKIGLPNSYALLNEIEFLSEKEGEELFNAIFPMGLPIAEDATTAFNSAKALIPLILEMMLYGEISIRPGVDLRNKGVMIDWTNFRRDVNASDDAEKGGRYYTFGYSELRFNREESIRYCKLRYEIEELEEKIEEEVQELAGVLKDRKEKIPKSEEEIDTIFLDQAWREREVTFKGNLHYQLSYFEEIKRRINERVGKDDREKESLKAAIKEMTNGSEEVNNYIKEVKSDWKKIFEKYERDIGKLGLNNLKNAVKDMNKKWTAKLGFNTELISTAKKVVEEVEKDLKEKQDRIDSIEKSIKDLRAVEELINVKYINQLSNEIEKTRGEIREKKKELEGVSLKEEKGYTESYPVFTRIGMEEWKFMDRIYEIHKTKDIGKLTLSEIIKEVETDRAVTDYARRRVAKMNEEFTGLKIPPEVQRQGHPFVWNIVACPDDDTVLGMINLDTGSVTGKIVLQLGDHKSDFHKTRWQFMKMVGGEPLEAVKELEALKKGYNEYPQKKGLFTYPDVFESLEKNGT